MYCTCCVKYRFYYLCILIYYKTNDLTKVSENMFGKNVQEKKCANGLTASQTLVIVEQRLSTGRAWS